jgi:uncharacterized membrane protein
LHGFTNLCIFIQQLETTTTQTNTNMENLTIEIATIIYLVSTTVYLVLTAKKRAKINKNTF